MDTSGEQRVDLDFMRAGETGEQTAYGESRIIEVRGEGDDPHAEP
nr:hypothetical protein [Parvularcula maris]